MRRNCLWKYEERKYEEVRGSTRKYEEAQGSTRKHEVPGAASLERALGILERCSWGQANRGPETAPVRTKPRDLRPEKVKDDLEKRGKILRK